MTRTTLRGGLAALAIGLYVSGAAAQSEPATPPAAETAAPPPPPAPYTPPTAPAAADPAASAPGEPAAAPEAAAPVPPAADAATPSESGPDSGMAAAETLATTIEDVQIVGPWMEGERNGVWRTIMMQVAGKDDVYRFFVQQIERADGAQTILSTTEVKEIQGINGAIVGYRADEPSQEETSGLTIFFDIVPSDGEIAETYELHFTKDAPYVFGPATN